MDIDYIIDFEAFQNSFKKTEVSGEEVGELIMRMAGYFARYNTRMGEALRSFSKKKADIASQIDDLTGKTITSSKAEVMADATAEADIYEMARIHVQNIEQYINSLKALQRGVMNEYSHAA